MPEWVEDGWMGECRYLLMIRPCEIRDFFFGLGEGLCSERIGWIRRPMTPEDREIVILGLIIPKFPLDKLYQLRVK